MVTFPSAYTASINTGFNLVESVAAAPPHWWNWAEAAAARLRASRRLPVSRVRTSWEVCWHCCLWHVVCPPTLCDLSTIIYPVLASLPSCCAVVWCVLRCAVLWYLQLFSQDQLLLRCAASPSLSKPVAEALLPQLLRVAKREETLRVQLWGAGEGVLCRAVV